MSNKPRKPKKMNHIKRAVLDIQADMAKVAFFMTPSLGNVMALDFKVPKRTLTLKQTTIAYYQGVKCEWTVCAFLLTKNPIDGKMELEIKRDVYMNASYKDIALFAFEDVQEWADKTNPKRRVNAGFALRMGDKPITRGDVIRLAEIDEDFDETLGIITELDQKREREALAARLEKVL